jgi:CMP-N-acetylneuraminic acid synthetase
MNNVGVFSFARKQSQRCPNKMLRPFADTTLTDIVLKKLVEFGDRAFFAGFEPEFEEKSRQFGVNFIKRDKKSVNIDGPITEILSFLKIVDFEYLLIVNACLPFLRLKTIENFLYECKNGGYHSAFSVIMRRNFFIDSKRQPLNFDLSMKTINTKAVDPVYEFAHALYFFNKEYFFENGRYWDWKEVKFIEIHDKVELIDIDTEEDFKIAEDIYKTMREEA